MAAFNILSLHLLEESEESNVCFSQSRGYIDRYYDPPSLVYKSEDLSPGSNCRERCLNAGVMKRERKYKVITNGEPNDL